MTRLYIIRHGKPAAGFGEHDDPGLDATGQAQAEAARDALLSLPAEHRPTRVVSSPLRRCRETAQPTADALGVEVEIDPSVGEIPTPAGLEPAQRPVWLREVFQGRWQDAKGDMDYDVWRKAVAASLLPRAGTAVFSHYVAINAVMSHVEGHDQIVSYRPDHTSISTLDTNGETLTLVEKGREASTGVL